jgi:MFS family permease
VAVIGFVVAGAGAGIVGPLFGPMMQELAWSNGMISSLATTYTIGNLVSIPAVGIALDRFGARAVMAGGTISVAIGLLLASQCHSWFEMLACFGLVGIGTSASFYLPGAVVVTNWMHSRKSLGMGIIMGAMSAGAALFSPLITLWVERYGWRSTIEGIATLISLTLPLIWVIVRTAPSNEALAPASKSGTLGSAALPAAARTDLLSAVFILAVLSGTCFSIGMLGISFHVVAVLVKAGYSARAAGLAFGVTWLLSGLGSLALGASADRFGASLILALALLSSAAGTLFLLGAAETAIGVVCVVAFVLLWGASANAYSQLIPVIFAERFGSRHLGTLIGVEFAIAGVAGATAPVLTGLLYDSFGDYHLALSVSAAATFSGFLLICVIHSRRLVDGKSVLRPDHAASH